MTAISVAVVAVGVLYASIPAGRGTSTPAGTKPDVNTDANADARADAKADTGTGTGTGT
ncbi:hypothetical protein [Streptomyces sp. NBC_01429]|uniref:hypothetical protein n=1 Tax=Streptomyces sp. NBC_01429 TaxID=2903862 RepID=UPI002E2AE458|nr:hypothetical protein [Streptomyces sp. NBC_01429]